MLKNLPSGSIQFNNDKIKKLSNKFDLHEDIIKLMFLRGIDTEEEIYKDFELFKDVINHIDENDIEKYQIYIMKLFVFLKRNSTELNNFP